MVESKKIVREFHGRTGDMRDKALSAYDEIVDEVRDGRVGNFIVGTFRLEFMPDPERVKWPWPDVRRVLVGPVETSMMRRVLLEGAFWLYISPDNLGTWPQNQHRIAENDNGFVRLSEVANGE